MSKSQGRRQTMNPFYSTVNNATRAFGDSDLRIIYRNLPADVLAAYNVEAKAILLPRIDPEKLDYAKKRRYRANLYHELLHHWWSSLDVMKMVKKNGKNLIANLQNMIEDARIENKKEKSLIGSAKNLHEDNESLFYELKRESEKSMQNNRFGYLANSIRFHLLHCGNLPMNMELQEYYNKAMQILNDGRFDESIKMEKKGHNVSFNLACEIFDAWQEIRDKEIENEPKDQPFGEGNSSDDNNNHQSSQKSSDSEQSMDSGNQKTSETDTADGDGDGQNVSQSGSDAKSFDNQKKSGKEDQDDAGQGTVETDPESDKNYGNENASESEGSRNGGNTESNSGSADIEGSINSDVNTYGECSEKSGQEKSDNSKSPRSKSIEEEFNNAQNKNHMSDERAKEVATYGPEGDAKDFEGEWWKSIPNKDFKLFEGNPLIHFENNDREIVPDPVPDNFYEIEQSISEYIWTMRAEMARMLRSRSLTKKEPNHKHGRLDARQYHKVLNKNYRVKKRIIPGVKLSAAVTLLIDLSGSMQGNKASLAVEVATLLAETMVALPEIKFEILGYNSSQTNRDKSKLYMEGYTNIEIINYILFKQFHEPWRNVRERMGACQSRGYSCQDHIDGNTHMVGGCNCDHYNVEHAAFRLYQRPEEKKVLLILCDGKPSGYNGTYGGRLLEELKNTVEKIRKTNIKLFCFGIQTNDVEEFYAPDVEVINNLQGVSEKALLKLGGFLKY